MHRAPLRLLILGVCCVATGVLAGDRLVVRTLASTGEDGLRIAKQATDQLLIEFHQRAVDVLGESDIESMLGAERQRQLAGCSESECMAEITNALGARHLVDGSVSRSGSGWRVDVKLVDTIGASVLFRGAVTFEQETSVVSAVARLASEVLDKLPRTVAPGPVGPKIVSLVIAGVGVAALGVGVGLMAGASGDAAKVSAEKSMLFYSEADMRLRAAEGQATAGTVLAISGAAVTAAAVAGYFIFDASTKTRVSVAFAPGSAALVLGGVW